MQKIASPQELQAEIRAIMAFVHASEKPDRQAVASKLRELAGRVASEGEDEDLAGKVFWKLKGLKGVSNAKTKRGGSISFEHGGFTYHFQLKWLGKDANIYPQGRLRNVKWVRSPADPQKLALKMVEMASEDGSERG